jgi:protein tyrosine phosphatase (PTP) superfamily phosphohydrolase (DUF442 family)
MTAPDTPISAADHPAKPKAGFWKLVLIALLVGGGIWYIAENAGRWKDRFVPRKLRTVDAGQIYASGQIDRHLLPGVLSEDHIQVIVSLLSDDPTDPDAAAEEKIARDMGIERYVDPLQGDGTGDIYSYANAIQQIVRARQQNKVVLLHCSSGAQRSNGLTFYYRVFIEGWKADDAAREMIRNGHVPHSNPNLIPYLNAHMQEMADLLLARGVIDHVPVPLPQIQNF